MWIITRPDYEHVLVETRRARAVFMASALRGAAEIARRAGGAVFRGLGGRLAATGRALGRWHRRAATRRELARLDDHLLRDIGLSRGDIDRVAREMAEREPGRRAPAAAPSAAPGTTPTVTDSYGRAAHQLRTPLTAIRSLSEIVRDNPGLSPAERRRFLTLVVDESRRLDRAIDGVLDRHAA